MSKVLYEKVINNKLAQIIIEEDNITVSIIYDKKLIEKIKYDNELNSEGDWIKEFLLDSAVNTIINKNDLDGFELD